MNIELCPKEYEKFLIWNDAMMYCSILIIDDKTDWRLPTKEELDYIYHSENDFVGSLHWSFYWSSTEYGGNYAWVQDLSGGSQYGSRKYGSNYVRPVR